MMNGTSFAVWSAKWRSVYCSANKQKLAGIGILQLKTKPVQGSGSCTFENRRLVCCRMNKYLEEGSP